MTTQPHRPDEIQNHLRKRYIDRLGQRVRRLRKHLAERRWNELRSECHQLRSGEAFGYQKITDLATAAETEIPNGTLPKAVVLPGAKSAIEKLIAGIDDILTQDAMDRP